MSAKDSAPPGPLLEARNIAVTFGDKVLLDGLNIAVYPAEFIAVLALGGAGKTLLFRTLLGLQAPASGQVFWFGHDISLLPEREKQILRRSIGAAHQQGALFAELTVEENIALALTELSGHDPQHIRSTVEFTLEAAGLTAHRHAHPNALATVTLRKAALARALVLGPKVLISDDIFAGLDPRAERQINDYLRAMHILRSMATMILTHNVDVAFHLADRVAILDKGRIIVSGTPGEIRRSQLPEVVTLMQDDVASY